MSDMTRHGHVSAAAARARLTVTLTHGTEGRRAEVRWGDTLVTLPTVCVSLSFPIILLHSSLSLSPNTVLKHINVH